MSVRSNELLTILETRYGHLGCALNYSSPLELLIATILSAQCTDARVNQVTPALFQRYPTAEAYANADMTELESLIRPTGFYRNKAKSIRGCGQGIVEQFNGEIPSSMEELVQLPGVGRKTANVVLGTAMGKNVGVVVDTHVARLSVRLGLSREKDPVKIERDLMREFPQETWTMLSHTLIHHGRQICTARAPKCPDCPMAPLCPQIGLKSKKASL